MRMFSFDNYDMVGFDLDHTLCAYDLLSVYSLQYDVMRDYLVKGEGLDENWYPKRVEPQLSMFQRGLYLDVEKGFVIKVSLDGTPLWGRYGTRPVSPGRLAELYPTPPLGRVSREPLSSWDDRSEFVAMSDYSDAHASLMFGLTVDGLGKGKESGAWGHILRALIHTFAPEGPYYSAVASNPSRYMRQASPFLLSWLRRLKNAKKTFLVTGAEEPHATVALNFTLGPNWREYFDYTVFGAKKPGFFTLQRAPVVETDKKMVRGHWGLVKSRLGQGEAVYLGDNPLQDVVAASRAGLAAVAVVGELAEACPDPWAAYLQEQGPASPWGSYLCPPGGPCTLWSSVLKQYSVFAVPSVEYVADKPIGHVFDQLCPESLMPQ